MLARLLQDEFDREHDAQIHVRQHLQNLGNSKIKISMDLHRLRPQTPPSSLQTDEYESDDSLTLVDDIPPRIDVQV